MNSETEKSVQIGLMLPDGTIIWSPDLYKTHPLATNNDRATMVEVLKVLANEISFPDGELLTHYAWLKRDVYRTIIYGDPTVHNILDPDLTTPTEESEFPPETSEGPVPESEIVSDPGTGAGRP